MIDLLRKRSDVRVANPGIVSYIVVLAALCAATTSACAKPESQEVGGKIEWVYDYEEGKRLSRETGKPMFVVFRCER